MGLQKYKINVIKHLVFFTVLYHFQKLLMLIDQYLSIQFFNQHRYLH